MTSKRIEAMLLEAGLNRSQRQFCKKPWNSNVRLLAPAGCGKTFSLLWRCRAIVEICAEKGLPAPHFLLVAFTKAAKQEMELRLKSMEFQAVHATVRTLNAWGWEQIRRPGKELIVTRRQRQNVANHDLLPLIQKHEQIAACFKTAYGRMKNSVILMNLLDLLKTLGFTHTLNRSAYKAHYKHLKEMGLLPVLLDGYNALYRMEGLQDADSKQKEAAVFDFFDFWKKAVVLMESNNRYTLEDQKYWARMYFENQVKNERTPQGIARYSHIMIDEFQDVNPLDMALLKVAREYHSQEKNQVAMTVIGDDDQAIFGWRGTSPQYILYPERLFDTVFDTCILDTNYRSPRNIVDVSARLLSYNKERIPKEMKSAAKGRAQIKVNNRKKILSSIDATIALVHNLIDKKGCKTVALISRRQVSLFPYQVLFSAENLPYHVDLDIDIFEGEAMQSLQEILKIIYRAREDDVDNPAEALLTICDKIDKYQIQYKERNVLLRYIDKSGADSFTEALEALRVYPQPIKGKSAADICTIIDKLLEADSVYKFMVCIEENLQGLGKDYNKKDIDVHYKEPQFFRLTEVARKYDSDFKRFYRDIEKARKAGEKSRMQNADDSEDGFLEVEDTVLHLVTATRAKGHEYDAVIVLDADDNEWPNHQTKDIEEERRLFYVALSRARKYLYFVIAGDRIASRFLLEAGLV